MCGSDMTPHGLDDVSHELLFGGDPGEALLHQGRQAKVASMHSTLAHLARQSNRKIEHRETTWLGSRRRWTRGVVISIMGGLGENFT